MPAFFMLFTIMLLYLIVFGILIADYVMTSFALYTIAKRRGLNNPWLAWIPVAGNWTVGAIADDIDESRGFKRKWRVVLITLMMIVVAAAVIFYAMMFALVFYSIDTAGYISNEAEIFTVVFTMYGFIFVLAMAASAAETVKIICIYKIFDAACPQKVIKYLLLTILVPLAGPICLMKCRNAFPIKQAMYINNNTL